MLLGIPGDGLAAAEDIDHLDEWLSSSLRQWPARSVLSAARRSSDDYEMGLEAWCALGDVAQLPAWNNALAALGDRYVAVENRRAAEQARTHLDEAIPLLRAFARHVAVNTGNPDLFHKLDALHQDFKGGEDWRTQWWEVPARAVILQLHASYAEIPGIEHHLAVLEEATTVEDLRTGFHREGIATDVDPYELAARNKKRLAELLLRTHDLHQVWVEFKTLAPTSPEPLDPPADLDPVAYLHEWSDAEVLERALRAIDDEELIEACRGCTSIDDVHQRLELDPEDIHARRQERLRCDREAERRRRTVNVAGAPFEVGTESFGDLFERLRGLPDPQGPDASRDEMTRLAEVSLAGGGSSGGVRKATKTSHLHLHRDHSELIGVIGEIHAYRFLRAKFGNDVVTRDAWLSEIRLQVQPLVEGEPDNTSDSHGFDFEFTHHRRKWRVEVKATPGDDPQFDLGITEINAATRLARTRGGLWRILRVRKALSDQPEFDWLPNPFEEGSSKLFRLDRGGMTVSYTRRT